VLVLHFEVHDVLGSAIVAARLLEGVRSGFAHVDDLDFSHQYGVILVL
jgi:hypothetical protein